MVAHPTALISTTAKTPEVQLTKVDLKMLCVIRKAKLFSRNPARAQRLRSTHSPWTVDSATLALVLSCMNGTLGIQMEVLLKAHWRENTRRIAVLTALRFSVVLAVAVFDEVRGECESIPDSWGPFGTHPAGS
ncbi:hypothetical protein EI94DRAFT_1809251 [Lactarius quietus]|nr:hypothetical protein EI94DRAFT_1809251 [Lactarius quietus]